MFCRQDGKTPMCIAQPAFGGRMRVAAKRGDFVQCAALDVMEQKNDPFLGRQLLDEPLGAHEEIPHFDLADEVGMERCRVVMAQEDAANLATPELAVDGVHRDRVDPRDHPFGVAKAASCSQDTYENLLHYVIVVGVSSHQAPDPPIYVRCKAVIEVRRDAVRVLTQSLGKPQVGELARALSHRHGRGAFRCRFGIDHSEPRRCSFEERRRRVQDA